MILKSNKEKNDTNDYPSFFCGAFGHERRKPTTLGTNIGHLWSLEGVVDRRPRDQVVSTGSPIEERTTQSRSWAAWPEPCKIEIVKGIVLALDGGVCQLGEDLGPGLAKMTAEQWKTHVMCNHVPFSRECATCLAGAGKNRQHRKVPHPDAMTLSLDVCGPVKPGVDFRRKKSKYFLVGVYSIPVRKTADSCDPLPDSINEVLKDGKEEEVEQILQEEEREELVWKKLEVEAEDVFIKNYTIVETP